MRIVIKIILTILIVLSLPLSIYYGLRFTHTPFVHEYMNRSFVITLPNKVWFELNGATDLLDDDEIFTNDIPEVDAVGNDIGPKYIQYTMTFENDIAKKVQGMRRERDSLFVDTRIDFYERDQEVYTQKIFFSQYGTFEDNTYSQEGCKVHILSDGGEVLYDKEYSVITISYDIKGKDYIKDNLTIDILCR